MNRETHLALLALAKRRDPGVNDWWSAYGNQDRCLICDYNGDYRKINIYEHGLQHLKEHGLLAFL